MKVTERKTKLEFTTADTVWEKGYHREIVMEVDSRGEFAYLRLKNSRRKYPLRFATMFKMAVERHTFLKRMERAKALAEKAKSKKPVRKTFRRVRSV